MSVYLDASVLVTAIVPDGHWPVLMPWLAGGPHLSFSAWTVTEVSSALSHKVRTNMLSPAQRRVAETQLTHWQSAQDHLPAIVSDDYDAARQLILKHALLRAPDALHLAIASRLNLSLATFDNNLASAAQAEGIEVVDFGNQGHD